MTRPRWNDERVAELRRRMAEEGATLQLLADEHYISRQAIWAALNWEAAREQAKMYKRRRSLARKAAKLADIRN